MSYLQIHHSPVATPPRMSMKQESLACIPTFLLALAEKPNQRRNQMSYSWLATTNCCVLVVAWPSFLIIPCLTVKPFMNIAYGLMRERFIIRAIISLPKYSFIQAGAGGVTSLAYLEKRSHDRQAQPPIFARTVHYTGISKSGKEIEENDLPGVLAEWQVFERTGKLFLKGTQPLNDRETDDLFLIFPDDIHDRLDVSIHSPSYTRLMVEIEEMGR